MVYAVLHIATDIEVVVRAARLWKKSESRLLWSILKS